MRKIRVLLLLHEMSPTGAPKVALSAFEHFGEAVELRTLAYLGGPLAPRFRALGPVQTLVSQAWPGISASPQALARFVGHRVWSVAKARAWAGPLRRWKPDVIYVNGVAALLAARRLPLPSAPVLLHVHELDSVLAEFTGHSPALLLSRPDRYVAVSQAVSDALTERFGIPPEKVTVIPAFVDGDIQPPTRAPRGPDAPFVVGGAGVINWVKGAQLWLLTAFETKKRLGAGRVRFVWLGVPDNEQGWEFREMARKLGLTDDLEALPFMPNPWDWYRKFDAFALTSWQETASLALMENMLLERPVVCFRGSGGPWEFVDDAGVVIEDFSPPDMADALAALAQDPTRCAALGQAARRRVLDNYTTDRQAPKLLEEIQRLAGL